jgi:hypothetical protein
VRGIGDTNLVEFGRNDGPLLVERRAVAGSRVAAVRTAFMGWDGSP